jgi:mannitol-1-phosphate 5-dehydrogenase
MTTSADGPRVLIFGAGATGRGHIGQLAHASGFHLTFVERDPALVQALRERGSYTVRLHGPDTRDVVVSGFDVHGLHETEAIADALTRTHLVLTAVLAENLPSVAPALSLGIARRAERGIEAPLNVAACENMINASSALQGHAREALPAALHAFLDARVGFPNAMVARVVPAPAGDRLRLDAEDYNEWTVDRRAFLGDGPVPAGMELVDNLSARLERKLFMHNTGHAVCGYLGHLRGHAWMCDAVVDPWIQDLTRGAMTESGEALIRKHGFSPDAIAAYREDFFPRVAARAIADPVARVIRSPRRKIGRHERLVGPACMALDYGLPAGRLALGIAALLLYHAPDDPEAVALRRALAERGLAETLREAAGVDPLAYPALIDLVDRALRARQRGEPPWL